MRTLALSLVFTAALVAQQGSTITATLGTSISAATQITNIPNIGQSIHQILVRSHDAPSHICTSYFTIQMQGSYDGLVYFIAPATPQGATLNGLPGRRAERFLLAQGAYPVLAMAWAGGTDFVNCVYDVFYTGVLTTGSLAQLTSNTGFSGLNQASKISQAISGDLVLGANPGAGGIVSVYELKICNQTANTTYTLSQGPALAIPLYSWPAMAAGQCDTFALGAVPHLQYLSGGPSQNLYLNSSQAAVVSIYIQYRVE